MLNQRPHIAVEVETPGELSCFVYDFMRLQFQLTIYRMFSLVCHVSIEMYVIDVIHPMWWKWSEKQQICQLLTTSRDSPLEIQKEERRKNIECQHEEPEFRHSRERRGNYHAQRTCKVNGA